MRNWSTLISLEAEKIASQSRLDCEEQIRSLDEASERLGELLYKILNQITLETKDENGFLRHVVRSDETLKEWEATFAVINMCNEPVIYLTRNGYYMQSLAVLRQELEGIAQLTHILDKSRTTKKSPNVGRVSSHSGRYGELSEAAHLASHRVASLQSKIHAEHAGGFALLPHGHSILPTYNKEFASEILKLHLEFRNLLANHLQNHILDNKLAINGV